MKINKYLIGLAVAVLGGFTSCNTDVEGEHYTTPFDNISFEAKSKSVVVGVDQTSAVVPIRITRSNTNGALTVNYTSITSANADGIFSDDAHGTISFEQGQGSVTINVSANNLEKEVVYADTLILNQAAVESADTITKNQIVKAVVTVQREGDWVLIGTGTFTDNFWFEGTGDVQIYVNELNHNQYRVKNPWEAVILGMDYDPAEELDGNQTPNLNLTILQPGNTLGDVTITQENLVYFSSSNTGYFHSSYSQDIWIHHPAMFSSLSTEDKWMHSKVLDYKPDGTPGRIQLAPYYYMDGVGGWNNTQKDDIIIIDFPGYEAKDFGIEMVYEGVLTDPAGDIYAVGDLALGGDATNILGVIVSGDADPAAVADAIASGDLEGTPLEGGEFQVPIPEDMSGELLLVIVVVDNGEVKNFASTKLEWYGGGANPWTSLGVGYFVDDVINPLFGYSVEEYGNAYEVEIKENNDTPGLYNIVKMFGPVAADFNASTADITDVIVHAENPNAVYLPLQPLGLTIGSNGPFSISSDAGELIANSGFDAVYTQAPKYFGKLENGEITFPVLEGETSSGGTVQYQVYAVLGESYLFGGRTGNFKIVLPTATAPLKAKMKARAAASSFARRIHGIYGDNGNRTIKKNMIKCRVITNGVEQMK